MEKNFRIIEALALFTARTGQSCERELASKLWPQSTENTQIVNMRNLKSGKTKNLDFDSIVIICDLCKCDPNFLIGWKN